jgi:hypothetical protein
MSESILQVESAGNVRVFGPQLPMLGLPPWVMFRPAVGLEFLVSVSRQQLTLNKKKPRLPGLGGGEKV